ncbi:hypothetical protein ARMGADRAFT_117086 [Armillaria gallica]|uniref:Uncharacterized protein n=1 Tax=Armillaria gallica TaxID=47427 RepID=A0A2H3DFX4_ARMGA|nr:hypothetical protein ARMGADRAFT_117086 [Armillaria gallica]
MMRGINRKSRMGRKRARGRKTRSIIKRMVQKRSRTSMQLKWRNQGPSTCRRRIVRPSRARMRPRRRRMGPEDVRCDRWSNTIERGTIHRCRGGCMRWKSGCMRRKMTVGR